MMQIKLESGQLFILPYLLPEYNETHLLRAAMSPCKYTARSSKHAACSQNLPPINYNLI